MKINKDFKVKVLPRLILVRADSTVYKDVLFMKGPDLKVEIDKLLDELPPPGDNDNPVSEWWPTSPIMQKEDLMSKKQKFLTYIFMVVIIVAFLVYGMLLGDPQDMRIEASGLWLECIGIGWSQEFNGKTTGQVIK